MATIYAPIWKDTYYTSSADTFDYTVVVGGELIYAGKAYAAPDAETLKVNVSKICQDYLSNSLPDFRGISGGTFVDALSYRSFDLYDGEGTLINTYNFLYCWDYETDFNGSRVNLSHPVNGHYSPNMKVFSTEWSDGTVRTEISENQGDYCGNAALYYKNRSGGWDSFLIEGNIKRTDNYEKYTFNTSFNNNSIEFEEGTYHNQITVKWVLHTGFLSDSESKTLAYNLLSSNAAYFHNFEDDSIVPCIIGDSSVSYKTYKNEGRKLVRYDINITESQKKQLL